MKCNWMRCPLLYWKEKDVHYEDWKLKAKNCPAKIIIKHQVRYGNELEVEELEIICGCLRKEIE